MTIKDLPLKLQVEGVVINNGQPLVIHLSEAQVEALVEINLPLMDREKSA